MVGREEVRVEGWGQWKVAGGRGRGFWLVGAEEVEALVGGLGTTFEAMNLWLEFNWLINLVFRTNQSFKSAKLYLGSK